MKLVDVDGRTIAYRRAGTGSALVFLHGGWSDGRAWRPQLAGLADRFDVIAWDAPGCGGSDDPAGAMTMADYADELAALVAELGIEVAHLCGLSWGGGLAPPCGSAPGVGPLAGAGRSVRRLEGILAAG